MKRSYLDPIHQDIILDRGQPEESLIIDLIDSREFQRLRRINQMGVLSFTFHGAEGSRFTHSVGAMHVANQLFRVLADQRPHLQELRALVLASALLHDIGHGPLSHASEEVMPPLKDLQVDAYHKRKHQPPADQQAGQYRHDLRKHNTGR